MLSLRPGPAFLATFLALTALTGCGSGGNSGGTTPSGSVTATLSTTAVTFSGVTLNTATAAQPVTLSNNGTLALNIGGITLGGADAALFTLTNSCASTLAAGASCNFTISFKTSDLATHTATIMVSTSSSTSGVSVTPSPTQTVTLSGSVSVPNKCGTTVPRKSGPTPTASYAGTAFSGKVLAGTTPIIGASVQLYAAGNTGNGLAPTALGAAITTDSTGAFTLPATYTCPYNLSVLYLVARGGKPGATGTTNAASVLIAALGTCNAPAATTGIVLNEATTVAASYAFAQFLAAGGNIGASSTNFLGLRLAAATAANLVSLTTGTAPGLAYPSNGTPPTLNLNALANALHACIVNAPGTACTQLFSATTVSGTAPGNTLDAALNIARHPTANVAAVYALTTASTAFAPAATAAPTDWTFFNTFTGGGLNAPTGIGIDSTGQVDVANYFSVASFFSNSGAPIYASGITGGALYESYGLAVDQADNVWIPDQQSPGLNGGRGAVTLINTATAPPTLSVFSDGGVYYPTSIAIDSTQTVWVVDNGSSHTTLLNASGTPISGTGSGGGYTSASFAFPVAVAVDAKCYGFFANQASANVTRVSQDGSDISAYATGYGAAGVAVDPGGNIWTANYSSGTVGLLAANATVVSSSLAGGGLDHPQGVAIDGAGYAWVANFRAPGITEFAPYTSGPPAVLSPTTGIGPDAKLLEAFALAIDPAGNLWVTSFGNNAVVEFIGLAAPVRTPLIGPATAP